MKSLLLGIFLISLVSCSGGRNSTGYSIINDMIYSETYEAFSDSQIHENGQSMQAPPANTIARGFMPHEMDEDDVPVVMENPNTMTAYGWKRGELLYNSTCAACHGEDGQGKGLVVTQGGFPNPPKFKSRSFKYSKKDKKPAGHIYNVITFGSGNMPSHAQQLYAEDRWLVAEYVRERLMTKGKK
ncbi:MAG: c-type cytochrome [Halobacteriovoraceae bacterium]|nr:c-type cytochrome [Halobacteriovoraceae bacterium]